MSQKWVLLPLLQFDLVIFHVFFVFAKALRVLKSLQIHGVILGGWAKLHELAEQLLDGIFARNCSFFVDEVVVTVDPMLSAVVFFFYGHQQNVKKGPMCLLRIL